MDQLVLRRNTFLLGLMALGALVMGYLMVQTPMAMVLPVVALVAGWTLLNPQKAILLMVFVSFLQRSFLSTPGLLIAWLPVAALLMVLALEFLRGRKIHSLRENPIQWIVLGFLAYSLLSLYVRASLEHGGSILVDPRDVSGVTFYKFMLHAFGMFLAIAYLVETRAALRSVVLVVFASLMVASLIGLHQLVTGLNYAGYFYGQLEGAFIEIPLKGGRIPSLFWDANHFGNFLVTSSFLAFPFLFSLRLTGLQRSLVVASLAVAIVLIYFTFSVANWMALVAGALAMFLWLRKKGRALATVGAAIIMVLLLTLSGNISSGFLPEGVSEKFTSLGRAANNPTALERGPFSQRYALVQTAFWMFSQNPAFGTGSASFIPMVRQAGFLSPSSSIFARPYSHNSYAVIVGELGLVGVFLLALLLYFLLRAAVYNIRRAGDPQLRLLAVGLFAAIIANLVFHASYGSLMYQPVFWVAVGLTVALNRIITSQGAAGSVEVQEPRRNTNL